VDGPGGTTFKMKGAKHVVAPMAKIQRSFLVLFFKKEPLIRLAF
jgi:hypothetical protein